MTKTKRAINCHEENGFSFFITLGSIKMINDLLKKWMRIFTNNILQQMCLKKASTLSKQCKPIYCSKVKWEKNTTDIFLYKYSHNPVHFFHSHKTLQIKLFCEPKWSFSTRSRVSIIIHEHPLLSYTQNLQKERINQTEVCL